MKHFITRKQAVVLKQLFQQRFHDYSLLKSQDNHVMKRNQMSVHKKDRNYGLYTTFGAG